MRKDHKSQPPERKPGWPEGDDDVINKYGTYEIQRTNGMENLYPMIAQGISPQEAQKQLNRVGATRLEIIRPFCA